MKAAFSAVPSSLPSTAGAQQKSSLSEEWVLYSYPIRKTDVKSTITLSANDKAIRKSQLKTSTAALNNTKQQ
jgi:hypothetical protein